MVRAAVLTCDVVRSREFRGMPRRIASALQKLNERYRRALVAPIVITLGDEFQCVLKEINRSYDLYLEAEYVLKLPIYAGLGIGTAETGNNNYAPHMTGVAFVRSRNALNLAKLRGRRFVAQTGNNNLNVAINTLSIAVQYIRSLHTQRQASVVDHMLLNPRLSQTELSKKLGVSKSAVSQVLRAAGFEALNEVSLAMRQLLGLNRLEAS